MSIQQWHEQAQAEYQSYADQQIVSTYGRLPMEYAAIFRSTACFDMTHRGLLKVAGDDRHKFLNSLLTAELINRDSGKAIAAGEVKNAFLLDRKGRVLSEMRVIETGSECLLEMDSRLLESTRQELEKYHFREKVTIEAHTGVVVLGLLGPAAARTIQSVVGADVSSLASGRCALSGDTVIYRDDLGDAISFGLILPAAAAVDLWQRITLNPDVVAIGWAAWNAARIEASRAVFGIDYDSTFLPSETGQLTRNVSFQKGCYPGQEIVARMASHDQLARKVVQIKMADDAMPLAGEKVFDDSGAEVGGICSSTISPRQSGRALALAIIRKPHFTTGTLLKVPAEGRLREASVIG